MPHPLIVSLTLMSAATLVMLVRALLSMRLEAKADYTAFLQALVPEAAAIQVLCCGMILLGVGTYSPEWYLTPFWLLPLLLGTHLSYRQSRLAFRSLQHARRWAKDPILPSDPVPMVDQLGMCAIIVMPVPTLLWGSYELAKLIKAI